ncbi:MAG TPA: NAD(P)/FAD-dependent oxidoreductase [Chloroflexota bacterium]|jgi:2-polyprenyl-6-methoxyphenol hydroxylase-like FAD-dependent oxidoreductase
MAEEPAVIVVGAAVAGSAVANALGARGIPTLVVEKGFERDNSTRGDFLHPPTLRFLEPWGVLEGLFRDGALPIYHLAVSHRTLGRLATYDIPSQGTGPASRTIAVPHDRIEAVMKACAEHWPSVTALEATVTGLVRKQGRVVGVRVRTNDGSEAERRGRLVIGCDGAQSVVRRELGIDVERHPYDHYFIYLQADGPTDPPAAIHFCLDESGVMMVASRPNNRMRIAMIGERGVQNELLRYSDGELYKYVTYRIPWLEGIRLRAEDLRVYSIARSLAERFWAPDAALVGDAAHTTHPAGATGMNLAITGAARLVERIAPLLAARADDRALDDALHLYSAERRPAAAIALERNHEQSRRIWTDDCHLDPLAYARNADPTSGWGAGGAGWGQDPAAIMRSAGY